MATSLILSDDFGWITSLVSTYCVYRQYMSLSCFYRALLAQSAVMRLHVVCLSVC